MDGNQSCPISRDPAIFGIRDMWLFTCDGLYKVYSAVDKVHLGSRCANIG